jgi:hypothetical protein
MSQEHFVMLGTVWLDLRLERADCHKEDKSAAWSSYYESSPQVFGAFVVKALQYLTTAGSHWGNTGLS